MDPVCIFPILFIFNSLAVTIGFYMRLPEVREKSKNSHLTDERVKMKCLSRDTICKDGGVDVCAVRLVRGERQYAHFQNSCYLFMSNMCDHPGEEFSIMSSGSCDFYTNPRRTKPSSVIKNGTYEIQSPSTAVPKANTRGGSFSTLYEVETSFDYHVCPLSCPDTYKPVCVSVNRGFGQHFKFFTFVNHCTGDLYYCKHWKEFSPPPNEDENVVSSPLGWSYCGSSRYLQFARFAEVTSSMGHYGWLAGDYNIGENYQRRMRRAMARQSSARDTLTSWSHTKGFQGMADKDKYERGKTLLISSTSFNITSNSLLDYNNID